MRGGLRMSTIDRNADKCEAAAEKRCVCSCGGELHGRKHSRAWRQAVFDKAAADQAARVHQVNVGQGKGRYIRTEKGYLTLSGVCRHCSKRIPRARWFARCPARKAAAEDVATAD